MINRPNLNSNCSLATQPTNLNHGFTAINHLLIGRTNFARSRPATQSSTWNGWEAGRAVDGDTVNTASSTDFGDLQPWWKVHLAYPVLVTHVEIINHEYQNSELHTSLHSNKWFAFNSRIYCAYAVTYMYVSVRININNRRWWSCIHNRLKKY